MQHQSGIQKLASGRFRLLLPVALILGSLLLSAVVAILPNGYLLIAGLLALIIVIFTIRYPVIGFYISLLFSFFIFDFVRFTGTDLPLVSLLDIYIYITFFGVVVNKLVKREKFWLHCNSIIVFMYVLVLLYFLLQFFNPNGGSRELYFLVSRRYIALLLLFYVAIQLFRTGRDIKRFFKVFLILSVICGLYAVYQHFFGMMRYEFDAMFRDPELQKVAMEFMQIGRLRQFSFLSDCTAFGLLMAATAIIPLIMLLQMRWKPIIRIGLWISLVVLILAMSYSGTRTATVMLLGEIGLYACITLNHRKTLILSVIVGVGLVAILLLPSYGNQTIARLKTTFDSEDASLNVRDANRKNIQPYIYSHPIGGGIRTTGGVFEEYNRGHPLAGFPTDSGLLTLALETGWIGLLLQCVTYFIFLQQGIHYYFRSRSRVYKSILLASTVFLFGYVIAQYSQVATSQIPGSIAFYSLLAVIIRLPQIEAAEEETLKEI